MQFNALPTERQERKYARLFLRVDNDNDGYVTRDEAMSLFVDSKLSPDLMRQVVEVIDANNMNMLDFPRFVAGMHLIRMALKGQTLPHPMYGLPPPLEEYLERLSRKPLFELAQGGTSRAAADLSNQQRGRPARRQGKHVPTSRDLRKFARLFQRTDVDGNGYLAPDQASDVFERSGLGDDVVRRVMHLVDLDPLGSLSFPQFVGAMHLLGHARAEPQSLPALSEGLPVDLNDFLRNLREDPSVLATEGSSRSASRSASAPRRRSPDPEPPFPTPPSPRARSRPLLVDPVDPVELPRPAHVPRQHSPAGATQMGLPVDDRAVDHGNARLREILGQDPLYGPYEPPRDQTARGRSSPRHGYPHEFLGDHASPVMRTLLIGALPSESMLGTEGAKSAVLPAAASPLLKTIVPNYRYPLPQSSPSLGVGSVAAFRSKAAQQLPRSTAPIETVRQRLVMGAPRTPGTAGTNVPRGGRTATKDRRCC